VNQIEKQTTYLVVGMILITIGTLWLFKSIGIELPEHLISVPTIIMLSGLIVLIKAGFKSEAGWVIFAFGWVLLLNRMLPNRNLNQIGTASILLVLGAYYVLRYLTGNKNKID
jgi:hypothetical protein